MKHAFRVVALASLGLVALVAACVNAPADTTNTGGVYGGDDDDSTSTNTSNCTPTATTTCPTPAAPPPVVDGRILALTTSNEQPVCLTVDEDSVYWVRADGSVGATSTTNVPSVSPPMPTYASTGVHLSFDPTTFDGCGIAVDGNYLYVTDFLESAIKRFTITKTADFAVVLGDVATLPGFTTPSSIAFDSDYGYVTEFAPGTIHRFPKAGTSDAGSDAGTSDGGTGDVLATDGSELAIHVFVDDTSIYWTSGAAPQIALRKMPKTGGAVTVVSNQSGVVHEIGSSLYFQCLNQLCTLPVSGGLTTSVVLPPAPDAGTSPQVHGIGVYGNELYFADGINMGPVAAATTLFVYASTTQDVTLFAQKDRLVWSDGSSIKTRGIEVQP